MRASLLSFLTLRTAGSRSIFSGALGAGPNRNRPECANRKWGIELISEAHARSLSRRIAACNRRTLANRRSATHRDTAADLHVAGGGAVRSRSRLAGKG